MNFLGKEIKNVDMFNEELLANWTEMYHKYSGTSFEAKNGDTLHYYKEPNYLGEDGDIFRLAFIHTADGTLYQLGVVKEPYMIIDSEVFAESHRNALATIKAENPPVDGPKDEVPTPDQPTKEVEEPKEEEPKPEEPKPEEPAPEKPKEEEPKQAEPEVPEEPKPEEPKEEPEKPEEPKGPESLLNGVKVVINNDLDYLAVQALEGKKFTISEDGKLRIYELLKALNAGEISVDVFFHEIETGFLTQKAVEGVNTSNDLLAIREAIEEVIKTFIKDMNTPR
nr:MAG TPA: hypothetical protein [Caudoviricetes sp.]